MKKTILITISILSVALIGLAFARGHGWRPCAEERVAHITSEIAERLDLSAAQKMTLDGIAEDFLEERQQVMKDRRAFKIQFDGNVEPREPYGPGADRPVRDKKTGH
jgi:hypothetical protein